MVLSEGQIVLINGYKAKITEISYTNNGIGFVYLEGPKKGWEDWAVRADQFTAI